MINRNNLIAAALAALALLRDPDAEAYDADRVEKMLADALADEGVPT
jgi:hypothetical protein